MRPRAREESGSVLIVAVMILMITLVIGIALAATADTQVHAAKYERNREASFELADAALNAQALQLGRNWPRAAGGATSCDKNSTSAMCPLNSAIMGGYTAADYTAASTACPTTWSTTVRDNNAASEKYWTASVGGRGAWDGANDGKGALNPAGDNVLWVKASATVKCRTQTIVAQVRFDPLPPITVPGNVITSNWLATGNQGNKKLIDTQGTASQGAPVLMRCNNLTSAQCLQYPPYNGQQNKNQVVPPTTTVNNTVSASTLSPSQLDSLKQSAQQANLYYEAGNCNFSRGLSSINKAPVYIEGPCDVSVGSNTQVNSAAAPGALIIANGTFSMSGNSAFYGFLYTVNNQNSAGSLVNLTGNANFTGISAIDGAGGMTVGGSGLVSFDPRATNVASGSAGATVSKGTWRQLPSNTP